MHYNHFCSSFIFSGLLDIVDIKKLAVKLAYRLVAQANGFMGGVRNEKCRIVSFNCLSVVFYLM